MALHPITRPSSRTPIVMIFGLVMAVMVTLTSAQFSSNDTACTRHYTVIEGDTCDKIGQKTYTSTYQIMSFNLPSAGSSCYTLEIGATLCLGRYGNDCQLVHEASGSESCKSIANQYNITVDLLKNNNPLLNCDLVYDGLMLCVAPGVIRPPSDISLNRTAQAISSSLAAASSTSASLAAASSSSEEAAASAAQTTSHAAKAAKGHVQAAKAPSYKHHHAHHNGHHQQAAKHYQEVQEQNSAKAAAEASSSAAVSAASASAAKKEQEKHDADEQDHDDDDNNDDDKDDDSDDDNKEAADEDATPHTPPSGDADDGTETDHGHHDDDNDDSNRKKLKGILGGDPIVIVGDPEDPFLVE